MTDDEKRAFTTPNHAKNGTFVLSSNRSKAMWYLHKVAFLCDSFGFTLSEEPGAAVLMDGLMAMPEDELAEVLELFEKNDMDDILQDIILQDNE